MAQTDAHEKPLDILPGDLRERVAGAVRAESVGAAAPYDLDAEGRYVEGYLVLTDGKLGAFQRRDGAWEATWTTTSGLSDARIVEGIGLGILRLLGNEAVQAEYRFTMRHARRVAALQRQLERRLTGKDQAEPPKSYGGGPEKKVRCERCGQAIPPWSERCPVCLSRKKILSRLLDFVKPYKWRAICGFLMAITATVAGLVRPALTRPMLDKGLGLQKGVTADYGVLIRYLAIFAGLMLLTAAINAGRQRLMAVLASRMGRDVRDKAYAHLHKLSLSYFSKKPTGSLVTRVTSDSDRIWDFVAFTLIEVVIGFLTLAGVGLALFLMNWKLALIVLIPMPLMLLLMVFFHNRMHSGFDRLFHRWSVMTAVIADALPGVRVIKAFSQERREVERFGGSNAAVYDSEVEMATIWTVFGPAVQFCSQIGTILVWVVGGWWAVHGQLTPGTLMSFIMYMGMFYEPVHMIAHMDRMFNRAATSVHRIFEILDTEPVIFSHSEARPAESVRGQIDLRDVSFSYDGVRKVLKGVSMTIEPGEMIGLAGPSGGGKTTLINLICRFYDVLEGAILIDGVDVRDYDVHALRRRIGVVLQEPFLFHGTIAQNIAYGHPEATLDDVIASSRAANAHDFIVGFPDGYDTMVGERGHTLSGGERQRISIARAILCNPAILILDEATSSVDTETEKLIQDALDRLVARRTTIAIAHRLSTLRKADRLLVLDKGIVVEHGPHDELSKKEGGVYAKLLRMQSELQAVIAIGG